MTSTAITFRQATSADHHELSNLAQLDSTSLADGPFEVAEIDGRIVAAVSTRTGAAIADPFRHTAEIVHMLRTIAAPKVVNGTRRHLSVRRLRPVAA